MSARRDALAGAAECVLAVERLCAGGELVGTVGSLQVEPGAGNVIPGIARWSVDVRGPDDRQRETKAETIMAAFEAIARARGLMLTVDILSVAPSTPCAPFLIDCLAHAIEATTGHAAWRMPSGAGHDAIAMSALTSVGMIFVRCRDGISHRPDEYVCDEDTMTAYAALETFVLTFDGTRPSIS